MTEIKVLVVGDWLFDVYEEFFFQGFKKYGCQTDKFSWIQYFNYYQYPKYYDVKKNIFKSIYYRFQNKLLFGPALRRLNKDLISKVGSTKYDLVFVYRGTHVYPSTIQKIRNHGCVVFGYNNDDAFSVDYPSYYWRHFLGGVKYYSHIFCYREKNFKDYSHIGYNQTSLLRSYYCLSNNFPTNYSGDTSAYKSDVVFVGHYEPDGRDEVVLDLLKAGVELKIYGPDWDRSPLIKELIKFTGPIRPVYKDYNDVLNGASIALVFLSKRNNDTYTRRVFEIPATKTAMVSEYSEDIRSLFEEGKEVLFFKNGKECIQQIKFLLNNPELMSEMAESAYRRVISEGHEVSDRIKQIIAQYEITSKMICDD